MKKLFLLILVFGSYIYALEIDECKTDVYFANGILTNEGTASSNALLLKFSIIEKRYKGNIKEYKKHIGKVKEAYNETHFGGLGDLLESLAQKLGVQGHIDDLASFFSPFSSLIQKTSHDRNLETQIASYADSIVHGHKVLVVAHSQGNLFTYEAREKLLFGSKLGWASKYFQVVSIASPAMFAIPGGTPLISWDNDLVAWLGIYNSSMVHNPIRKVDWQRLSPAIGLGTTAQKPTSNYINDSQVGTVYKKDWKAYEGILSKFDSVVHAFTFYMGEDLAGGKILNPFDGSKLHTDKAKNLIMHAVDEKLTYLENLDSQWETDQEFDKNTCNYRITVKHRYYSSLEIGEKVYPFNGSKKLYQVNGEYVKASCGGENILETWDGKKDNECLMIDNVEKEKILGGQRYIRDDDKDVVLDTNTSLMWQDNVLAKKPWLSFDNMYVKKRYMDTSGNSATTYCTDLTLGGYKDWRLPSIDELESVGRPHTRENRNLMLSVFRVNPSLYYWSNATVAGQIISAWQVHLTSGHQTYTRKGFHCRVRCVRAGQ